MVMFGLVQISSTAAVNRANMVPPKIQLTSLYSAWTVVGKEMMTHYEFTQYMQSNGLSQSGIHSEWNKRIANEHTKRDRNGENGQFRLVVVTMVQLPIDEAD